MCGRFPQGQSETRYAISLDPEWTPLPLDFKPTWNMSPSRQALVFHDDDSGHVAELFYWGFLPSWADATAQKPINARVETAATKPYFRHAWKSGRCLVPADGWYEWKETPGGKQPYFIHRVDNEPVFLAGLYETNSRANGTSFTILTMEATGSLRDIHEREPLVLSAEAGRRWIRRDLATRDISPIVHDALTSESFAWHKVSTKVNNARNDVPDLVTQTL